MQIKILQKWKIRQLRYIIVEHFLFLFSSLMTYKHIQMFKVWIFYDRLINKLSGTDNNS